jgi:hypothetical protein
LSKEFSLRTDPPSRWAISWEVAISANNGRIGQRHPFDILRWGRHRCGMRARSRQFDEAQVDGECRQSTLYKKLGVTVTEGSSGSDRSAPPIMNNSTTGCSLLHHETPYPKCPEKQSKTSDRGVRRASWDDRSHAGKVLVLREER